MTRAQEEPARLLEDEVVERAARAMNFEAGRQRGLAFEDDWDEITEQERGGWRLCARVALKAVLDNGTETVPLAICPDPDCGGDLHAEWWYRCERCERFIAPRAVDDDPAVVRVAVPASERIENGDAPEPDESPFEPLETEPLQEDERDEAGD